MKGFIEVSVYSENSRYNNIQTHKCLFNINQISIINDYIHHNGTKYHCTISYDQIKELIKQAQ